MSLSIIQKKLNAPKNQYNSFGKYHYRNCEDILESVKPLLADGEIITVSDEVVMVGDRIYVKATATFENGSYSKSVTAFAREPQVKKGMDESQITGAASSYARKYALNGLLLIDDNKDADSKDNNIDILKQLEQIQDINSLNGFWKMLNNKDQTQYKNAFAKRKGELNNV